MRDILFKAKRVDNGEWVYGYYFKATHHWHNHGIHKDWIATDTVQNGGWCNVRGKYAVIPETVGQYTGLTDKNGKKIFEGDLLEWIDRIVEVVWFDFNAQFDSKFIRHCNDKIITNFKGIEPSDWHECKVIGNIHDNPELLEVK